jgi:hypothetical protein
MSAQWAAQFLVAAELERHGYVVSFTMGHNTPVADLMVGHPRSGAQFWVDVKGLSKPNAWLGLPKLSRANLFYILALVARERGKDRFFILTQYEWDGLIKEYRDEHPSQKPIGGFNWTAPKKFENKWSKLPEWDGPSN